MPVEHVMGNHDIVEALGDRGKLTKNHGHDLSRIKLSIQKPTGHLILMAHTLSCWILLR